MITLKIDGEKRFLGGLEKISSRAARRDLFDEIGSYGVSSTQQRFMDQKGPDGEKWQQSARAKEQGGQTLRDDNHLFNSLAHEASADHAAWGSNRIYAAIHQIGGKIRAKSANALKFFIGGSFVQVKSVTMPARPYLGVNSKDETEIEAIVRDWVDGSFAR